MTVYTPSESPPETPLPAEPNPTEKVRTCTIVQRIKAATGQVLTCEIYEKVPHRRATVDLYDVCRVPSDFGQAFLVQGIGRKSGSRYHVNLAEMGGGEAPPICDCIGHEKGRCVCRHIALCAKLVANGSI